jgi:aryl-alcohol dehydrogenase-like predicted oxidoreductase
MAQGSGSLIVGTAQLSGAYGIANRHGMPSAGELSAILGVARSRGITMIDTAAAYGDAEAALGAAGVQGFGVISKLPPDVAPGGVSAAIGRSLERLRVQSLAGILLHRAPPEHRTVELLHEAREDKRVARVGVSVYEPAEVSWLLERGAPLDVVQAPFSVFDQRFRAVGEELAQRGGELHARSIFLQGLYFLDEGQLTGTLGRARRQLRLLRELAIRIDLPLPVILLRYAEAQPFVDKIVLGVELASQLEANVAAMRTTVSLDQLVPELDSLRMNDEDILLPSRWRLEP